MISNGSREELRGTEVHGTMEDLEALGRRRDALALGFFICGLLAYALYCSWEKAPNPSWIPMLWVAFIALVTGALVCFHKFELAHDKYKALQRKIKFHLEHPCQ